jgi:hypothetical protein
LFASRSISSLASRSCIWSPRARISRARSGRRKRQERRDGESASFGVGRHLSPLSLTPILLRLPLHCRRFRVLHLGPIGRSTGAVPRAEASIQRPRNRACRRGGGTRPVSWRMLVRWNS